MDSVSPPFLAIRTEPERTDIEQPPLLATPQADKRPCLSHLGKVDRGHSFNRIVSLYAVPSVAFTNPELTLLGFCVRWDPSEAVAAGGVETSVGMVEEDDDVLTVGLELGFFGLTQSNGLAPTAMRIGPKNSK